MNTNDSIYVRMLGYQPQCFTPAILYQQGNRILLQQQPLQLKGISISAINPLSLIQKAIQRIPENYYGRPHVMKGFYRLSARKAWDYIHISEAAFDLYCPDLSGRHRLFRLTRARMEKDLSPFHGVSNIVFGVKPENVFEYDVTANINESDVLSKQGLKDHRFSLNGLVVYNGRQAYELIFDQREGLRKSRYQGKIYLDKETLAILSLQYWLSPSGIHYWEVKSLSQRALMKLLDMYETVLQDTVQIHYRQYGEKYFLSHVSNRSLIRLHSGRVHFDFNCPVDMQYITTQIDTVAVKPFADKELLGHNRYIEHQGEENSGMFWKDLNLMPADYDVDSVAAAIHSRNDISQYRRMLENIIRKQSKQPVSRIDTILSFYHRKGLFDGAALIQHKGQTIYQHAFGWADRSRQSANKLNTKFRIGSITKQFTAMLILQLQQEGRLQLEDSVGKYLPDYIHKNITIAQLLTHQSGIPNCTLNTDYLSQLLLHPFSNSELVTRFCSDSLEFTSGQHFRYSNAGYMVLSEIIERVTGKKYADVLTEKIFGPLNMLYSHAGVVDAEDTLMATGYEGSVPETKYPLLNMAGAGAIISNATDLLIWEQALHSDKLLPLREINQMFQPHAHYKDWNADYGYGWMIDKGMFKVSDKHVIQYHPGTDMGCYSMILRQPDEGIVIILLSNSGDFPRFDMADLILQQLNSK
ncbi:beta-lactamase family protein [Chitinophaga pendula]|uniref:serine hydrolase domain-containing protein n=1 Tax=Chitinophaga TaxID=79328 RepID=UPI0012FDCD19|nr:MULTISPECIES: serine hydrolase domain-containing protein [Chitinophaga]UCJ07851.1 beta-lactamase family protein [Chitinophaga pendula]